MAPPPTRPFWSLNKIYWLLWVLPLVCWFAMDGTELFFLDKDPKNPERVWFKLGVSLLFVNVITFLAYREDRKRAETGNWRVPEKTMMYLITLGGIGGALLAMKMYRHKTSKRSFQLRLLFWFLALAAFTAFALPRTFSIANDIRWGICLFSLVWWNLAQTEGILRYHRKASERAVYLGLLIGLFAVFVGGTAGALYLFENMKGWDHELGRHIQAGVLSSGALLVVFNEIWLTLKGIRGKLPGWDPGPPEERRT